MSTQTRRYECDICFKIFARLCSVRRHKIRRHYNLKCKYCNLDFKLKNELIFHIRLEHTLHRKGDCEICLKSYQELEKHIHRVHPDYYRFFCEKCRKKFLGEDRYTEHCLTCTLICKYCELEFGENGKFRSHIESNHPDKRYQCSKCGHKFREEVDLQMHKMHQICLRQINQHRSVPVENKLAITQTNEFQSKNLNVVETGDNETTNAVMPISQSSAEQEENELAVSQAYEFQSTILNVVETGDNKTATCNAIVTDESGFEPRDTGFDMPQATNVSQTKVGNVLVNSNHNTANEVVRQCDYCKETFSSVFEEQAHRNSHQHCCNKVVVEKCFKCSYCGGAFKSTRNLTLHMNRLHIDKSQVIVCEKCGKTFKRQELLEKHTIVVHTREFPYQCHKCGKGFLFKGTLDNHIMEHDGLQKYLCNNCGKEFTEKTKFKLHMRRHMLDENMRKHLELLFVCEICGKKFKTKLNLDWHLHVHSGKKTYKCEVCGKCFGRSDNLNTHMRTHTGMKPYCCETCGKHFARGDNLKTHIKKCINEIYEIFVGRCSALSGI